MNATASPTQGNINITQHTGSTHPIPIAGKKNSTSRGALSAKNENTTVKTAKPKRRLPKKEKATSTTSNPSTGNTLITPSGKENGGVAEGRIEKARQARKRRAKLLKMRRLRESLDKNKGLSTSARADLQALEKDSILLQDTSSIESVDTPVESSQKLNKKSARIIRNREVALKARQAAKERMQRLFNENAGLRDKAEELEKENGDLKWKIQVLRRAVNGGEHVRVTKGMVEEAWRKVQGQGMALGVDIGSAIELITDANE